MGFCTTALKTARSLPLAGIDVTDQQYSTCPPIRCRNLHSEFERAVQNSSGAKPPWVAVRTFLSAMFAVFHPADKNVCPTTMRNTMMKNADESAESGTGSGRI